MPVYTCPECSIKIKRNNPVEAGKKLKCPECAAVFTVRGEKKAESAKAPAAPSAPKSEWDDDGPANYTLSQDADTKESQKEREKAYGPLKERFEKSKRGPALPLVVKPSDWLLRSGVGVCIGALIGLMVAIWPMVFKAEVVEEKAKKSIYDVGEKKTKFRELSTDEMKERIIWAVLCVGKFFWGAVICLGASKMHMLQHYWLAMLASVMTLINPTTGLGVWLIYDNMTSGDPSQTQYFYAMFCLGLGVPMSAWCIMTLLNKKVKAGFADDSPIV